MSDDLERNTAIQNGEEMPPPEEELAPEEAAAEVAPEATPEAVPSGKPDKSLSGEKISLERYPVTPAGHEYLMKARLAFVPELRRRLVDEAEKKGEQLTLAETKEVTEWFLAAQKEREEARRELYDSQPDEGAPQAEMTCRFPGGCTRRVKPATWNVVIRRGRELVVLKNREGEAVRRGNFVIVKNAKTGEFCPLLLCRGHYRDYCEEVRRLGKTEEVDTRSYPFAVAQKICDRLNGTAKGLGELILGSAAPKPKKRRFWDRLNPRRRDRDGD